MPQIKFAVFMVLLLAPGLPACTRKSEAPGGAAALQGAVSVDGSSTVFPITEAVAEEFGRENRGVRVTVGVSGTGGGFKKFTAGEIDICDASRKITASEAEAAAKKGIRFLEIPVAYDGITLVTHPKNGWVDHLTAAELKRIWEPESKVKTWRDVRAAWPDRPIRLFGPGTDSGTFDYFTEAINGKAHAARSDFTKSEDDNVLVHGVEGEPDSLGLFGYAYYAANRAKLRALPIDGGSGPVAPTLDTIRSGQYAPLSRPIFIYVSLAAAARPEVRAFVSFYLRHAAQLVEEVGYIPQPEALYAASLKRFEEAAPAP